MDRVDTNAMLVDDNYDPSAAFFGSMRPQDLGSSTIKNDLDISDSDEDEPAPAPSQEGATNIWF